MQGISCIHDERHGGNLATVEYGVVRRENSAITARLDSAAESHRFKPVSGVHELWHIAFPKLSVAGAHWLLTQRGAAVITEPFTSKL